MSWANLDDHQLVAKVSAYLLVILILGAILARFM